MTRIVRDVFWIAAALVVATLVVRDIQPDGVLEAHSDFRRATPYISVLEPAVRVAAEDGAMRILEEPVFFYLRLPRWFSRATVQFTWKQEPALPDPLLGASLDPQHPDNPDPPLAPFPTVRVGERDGWVTSEARLPYAPFPRSRYGILMLFSAPHASRVNRVLIRDVAVRAERDSLSAIAKRGLQKLKL